MATGGSKATWFLQVEGEGAVAETLKPAEDGDGWILRCYEAHGGRGNVRVRFDQPLAQVGTCNLVEEPGEEIEVQGNSFGFTIRPFEIKSFRLRFAP